jgi:hypothetical protein
MKNLVFPILGVLMFGFFGCMKPGDNINNLELPAIVGVNYDTFQPTITTSVGTFLAPELSSVLYSELFDGDAIWAYFSVNYDQPTTSGDYIAYDISYGKVDIGWTQATVGGESTSGEFDISITKMWAIDLIGNIMFFVFEQTAPNNQKMTYELTYDSGETSENVVYIRAKKDYPESSETNVTLQYPFAFNMYSFFMTHKDADNVVKFKIKYKTGVDDDGNDQYGNYDEGSLIQIKVE